jgi:hypothetical protein
VRFTIASLLLVLVACSVATPPVLKNRGLARPSVETSRAGLCRAGEMMGSEMLTVHAPADLGDVRWTLGYARDDVAQCYRDHFPDHLDTDRVDATLAITMDGNVAFVKVTGYGATFNTCLCVVLSTLRFPATAQGGIITIHNPLRVSNQSMPVSLPIAEL